MSTRLKVKCTKIEKHEGGHHVYLEPVTSGSPENEEFFKWTPSGKLDFGTVNEEAAKQFEPGREFYIDILEVTE